MAKSKRDIPRNSWFRENGHWYYMNSTGSLKKGWLNLANAWYYMNSTGAMETNQWVGNYYVGSDGKMVKNTTTPDGYLVGYDGQWIPAKPIIVPIPETPTNQQKPVETNDNNEPVKSLEEMEEYVTTHINKQHINDEFIKLLNEERKAHGITTVTYSPILFKGADIRSKEQEISFGHTRPNGESYQTVFPKKERFKYRTLLENAGTFGVYLDFEKNLEQVEVEVAKKMFNGWKNSPKHYEAMMVNGDLQVALSAHCNVTDFSEKEYTINGYSVFIIAGNASY
ncbi:CAP domain-containing protein [Granulicatella balaenopterae]